MKKILLLLFAFFLLFYLANPVHAIGFGAGYRYLDSGYFYSDVMIPLDAAKAVNMEDRNNVVPVSHEAKNKQTDKTHLKVGEATATNILGLVEWGDAGVNKAAKNGKITKIHYVQVNKEKLFIPMVFVPVYFKRYITTVYGE